jgi:hypothetical protein
LGIDSGAAIFTNLSITFMCICVKNVPPLGNYQLAVLAAWQQIRAWIKELVQVDAVTIGSHAHCFKLPWINLVLLEILQSAYQLIPRSPTCLVDDILDLGWHFSVIQHDERPPLAMVNKVGLLWATLPTLLSFLCFHAFQNGSSSMT